MKKIPAIFLLLLFCSVAFAQDQHPENSDEFRFVKNVPAGQAAGKNFRYEMAVHASPGDTLAGIRFYGIAADHSGKTVGGQFRVIEKRIEQDWTIFTIAGMMPVQASTISFFTSVTSSGVYYFDDISFYIAPGKGTWKQFQVDNPSFETGSVPAVPGYLFLNPVSGNPSASISGAVFKTGKHSLCISYQYDTAIGLAGVE